VQLGISKSTVANAISYFDRFLGTSEPAAKRALTDLSKLQLVFIACLVIALKVHTGMNVETDFVSNVVCENMYNATEINEIENQVLQALGLKLNGPTPHEFIDYYLETVTSIQKVHREFLIRFSKGLAELALTKYSLALHSPSELAFSSIFCAMQFAEFDVTDSLLMIRTISGRDQNDPKLRNLHQSVLYLVH
jgi:hypothetical protein